jgi:hypothetical protein
LPCIFYWQVLCNLFFHTSPCLCLVSLCYCSKEIYLFKNKMHTYFHAFAHTFPTTTNFKYHVQFLYGISVIVFDALFILFKKLIIFRVLSCHIFSEM